MSEIPTTKRERDLMSHALGGDARYRNYFATNVGDADWESLVERGLARRGRGPNDIYPHQTYHVTDLGIAQLPAPAPKRRRRS